MMVSMSLLPLLNCRRRRRRRHRRCFSFPFFFFFSLSFSLCLNNTDACVCELGDLTFLLL